MPPPSLRQAPTPTHRKAARAKLFLSLWYREMGLWLRRIVIGSDSQIFGDAIGRALKVDNLAGVHPIGRVPNALELGESPIQLPSKHLRQKLSARLSVAMFSRGDATQS